MIQVVQCESYVFAIISSAFKLVSTTISTADLSSISSVLIHISYSLPVITPTKPLMLSYIITVLMLENDDCTTIYQSEDYQSCHRFFFVYYFIF
jgi:hypothetical protein